MCKYSLISSSLAGELGNVIKSEQLRYQGLNGKPITCTEKVATKIIVDENKYVGDLHVVAHETIQRVLIRSSNGYAETNELHVKHLHNTLQEVDSENNKPLENVLIEPSEEASSRSGTMSTINC